MRRRHKSFFDEIFKRFDELFGGIGELEGSASMYSISVTYDEYGRPVVRVSTQGDVNKRELEEYLRERYPNAKIIWEGESEGVSASGGHVGEVVIDESESSRQRRPRGIEIREVDTRKPKIVEVKVESEEERGRKWYDIKVE
jgi:hypothetical protein